MSSELIVHFLRTVPIDDVMKHLACVSAYDRYQASQGIEEAASLVAETASAIGLAEVSIERFPADGAPRWWSFEAPVSWTPNTARLTIRSGHGGVLEVDHARQPFSVATYSAATPPDGAFARMVNVRGSVQNSNISGAIAVVSRSEFARSNLLDELMAGGAVGFVTDAPCRGTSPGPEYPGRIELGPSTSLFGFSLTASQLELVRTWADEGAEAHVVVDIDRSASMPVVTGVLPGERHDKEVWLTAHLCHPRPGANDNASGVAALLGVASALMASRQSSSSWRSDRAIRFFWGPEFLGMAAMLHRRMHLLGREGLPSAVINLDMVGEDQSLCGGPFVVERNPDCRPALINPIAEYVVGQVFAHTNTYHGIWQPAPFMGFSDHALFSNFADPTLGSAAVQFCHSPDRYNHSSGDSLDKVSAAEMLRSTAAAAALAQIMASDSAMPQSVIEEIVREWCIKEDKAARRTAQRHHHAGGNDWGQRFVQYIGQRNAVMLSLLAGAEAIPSNTLDDHTGGLSDGPAMLGHWSGPFNVRAMMADLPSASRSEVSNLISADKHNYTLLPNFAIRADGRRSQRDIIYETSFALQRPIDNGVARRLFGALIESGWVQEVPGDTRA